MIKKELLNLENLKAVNEVFRRLNNLHRWTSVITDDKYNELAKQALNCIVAYMLASVSEQNGNSIHWERFPKIAIYRAFQKVYVYFDTGEHIINEICKIGNINKDAFNKATTDIIEELTSEDFSEFLSDGVGTYEMQIYRAATKIATLVELEEIAPLMNNTKEYRTKHDEINHSLERFSDIPGVAEFSDPNGEIFKLLSKISKLRNQNRWAVQSYLVNCSVLGHLFDTAVLAYFIGLEQFEGNEKIATKMFFMGVFHDLAEVWTSDVPSPIKDRIPGFRSATEEYEAVMLERYLYQALTTYFLSSGEANLSSYDFMSNKIRSVMFEEESNSSFHGLMKSADYLSADSECWRQYLAGSRDPYFYNPGIVGYDEKLKKGKFFLPPICKQLHNYFLKYAGHVVAQFEI